MFDLNGQITGDSADPVPVKKSRTRYGEQLTEPVSSCSTVLTELSREMRTQMNAIVAFSFMMNNNEYSESEKEDFSNHIYKSCEQIISLFDNFLDSAIIDAGNSNQEPGVFNPGVIFEDLFSGFREEMKKDRYKDLLLVSGNADCKSPDCVFDANRVTRVIRNLFNVALSNTKSGYIKAGYSLSDGRLTFSVTDSGQGYKKCSEFLQSRDMADSLAKFNDIHTAVNLALTRQLIRMLDGSLWIESNGLTGSSIVFSIPVRIVENTDNKMNKFSKTMSAT